MPRGFISHGYADIFGYIYIIVETRRPNQRVLLFERKKRVSVETLFKTQYTRSTLAELRRATGGLETVLNQYYCISPSVFKAFRRPTPCFPLRVNPSTKLDFPRIHLLVERLRLLP